MSTGQQAVGHPVDVASGAVFTTHREVTIPGRIDLFWERHYSTALLDSPPSPLGPGWTSPYFATLTRLADEYRFVTPEGDAETFSDPGGVVERGGVIRNLGSCQELRKLNGRYCIIRWTVEVGDVTRYFFRERKLGEISGLDSLEDVSGQALEVLRDSAGRVQSVRQRVEQRALEFSYDGKSRVRRVTLTAPGQPDAQTLAQYEYDSLGRLAVAIDALGGADHYEYDAEGKLVREAVKDGGVFTFAYDDRGRCVKTSGLNRYDEKSLHYLDAIRWTEVTDSLGQTQRYQCNPLGQVIAQVNPLGATRRTEFDEHGRIAARIEANGATLSYEYDEQGNVSKVIDPAGGEYAFTFNDLHLPTTFVNPAGAVWRRTYDAANRLIQTEDPLGGSWTWNYDAAGNIAQVTDPTGAVKRQKFSSHGVLTEATDWRGNWMKFRFDAMGRMIEWTDSAGLQSKAQYNALGQPLSVLSPDGSRFTWTYAASGLLASTTDGNGRTTHYQYGTCGRLLRRRDAAGNSVAFHWGTEPRRLEHVFNENGEVYRYRYDAAGRVVEETGFDGRTLKFEYDQAGNYIRVTNGVGESIRYERDAVGRMIGQILSDEHRVAYEYDAAGNLIAAANPHGEIRFELDALGRVLKESSGESAVESRYNALGDVIETRSSYGHAATYELGGDSRLNRLTLLDGRQIAFSRDQRGDETSRVLPGNLRLNQQYDEMGRLVSQAVGGASSPFGSPNRGATVERNYAYDAGGLLTSVRDRGTGGVEYGYDQAERLTQAVHARGFTERFAYDQATNLAVVEVVGRNAIETKYASGGRVATRGDWTYDYDANGRLTRRVERNAAGSVREWRYAWNALDQLVSVRTPEGETWEYQYDALGRRISKKHGDSETRFVWDRDVLLHQVDEGRATQTWIYDPSNSLPVAALQNGSYYSVILDHLGTPREMIDESGRIAWSANYLAWGKVDVETSLGPRCPIRFQGQWADDESGLHYNYFRYYDPSDSRYLSPDPIGLFGGLNLYLYARDPVHWVDPFGLSGDGLKWDNPNSTPTFGHTFSRHGAGNKNTKALTGRAGGTGNTQGQWTNNAQAASFLQGQRPGLAGAVVVPIPPGMGKVILPNGKVVDATHALLVPKANGGYKTAYPITKDSNIPAEDMETCG